MKRPDLEVMFFRDDLGKLVDQSHFVDTSEFDARQKQNRVFFIPFGFDDPVAETRHEVNGIFTVRTVDHDGIIGHDQSDDVVAGDGITTFGDFVFNFFLLAEQNFFGFVLDLFPDGF